MSAYTRENNFDAMRFVFASAVIASHCWPMIDGLNTREPLSRLTGGEVSIGSLCVDAFFVISGYLIASSWERSRGFIDFMSKRARRIYPAFIAVSLIGAFVVAPLFADGERRYSVRQLGLVIFDIADLEGYGWPHGGLNVFAHNPVVGVLNGSLWTIRYEFGCYILVAIAGTLGWLKNSIVIVLVFLACWSVYGMGVVLPQNRLLTATIGLTEFWPRLLTYFFGGVLVWQFGLRPRVRYGLTAAAIACVVGGFPNALRLVLPIALPVVLFSVAFVRTRFNAFGQYGDFSYGIYVYGFLIQQCLMATWHPGNYVVLFVVAWSLSLLAGVISWYVVERRWLRRPARPIIQVLETDSKGTSL